MLVFLRITKLLLEINSYNHLLSTFVLFLPLTYPNSIIFQYDILYSHYYPTSQSMRFGPKTTGSVLFWSYFHSFSAILMFFRRASTSAMWIQLWHTFSSRSSHERHIKIYLCLSIKQSRYIYLKAFKSFTRFFIA